MKYFPAYRKSYLLIITIISLCFLLIQCIDRGRRKNETSEIENTKFNEFAGSESCRKCHAQVYNDFILTGHFSTSTPASAQSILGSFEEGKNTFHYRKGLYVSMEKTDSGFYQVEYVDSIRKIARKFDITVGSGERGQTYLSWQGNLLTLLPVSYLTSTNSWANNPGQHNQIFFDAPVSATCLQCHTSYAEVIPFRLVNAPEEFNPKKIIYGISCERCHGPAAQHVAYQTENPNDKSGKFIIKPSTFSRTQSLDMCAVCHGGRIKNLKPPFSFQSGNRLSEYYQFDTLGTNNLIDVHGNQYGLLKKSKCFQTSQLTCITCHSPHKNEEGNLRLFSQKCMTCHNEQHGICKINPITNSISANCIDCHMPEQPSKSIVLQLENNKIPTAQLLRTHDIAIYPAATKEFLKNEKKKESGD